MVDVDALLDIFEEIREGEPKEGVSEDAEAEESKPRAGSFMFRLPDASYFVDILKLFKEFSDEVTFEVSKDGLRTQFMDPASIALIKFRLDAYAFEELDAPDEPVRFTVNVKSLLKSLPRDIKPYSFIVIRGDEDLLKVTIYGPSGEIVAEVEPSLLETECWSDYTLKEWPIEATARLNAGALYRAVRTVKGAWDRVALIACDEAFALEKNDEEGKAKVVFTREDDRLYELEVENEVMVLMSAKYLEGLLKHAKKLTDEVKLSMASKKPLIVDVYIPGGEITYYQAPIIEG